MANQYYRADTYAARTSIGYLMRQGKGLMQDYLEPAFAVHGFTFMQWMVMMYLRDGIALNAKDICSEIRHDSGALTRVLDQLEERGLIARVRSLEDRRKVDLSLTEAGQKTVKSLLPIVLDGLNEALSDFSPNEFAELTRLLVKLNTAMARMTAPGVMR